MNDEMKMRMNKRMAKKMMMIHTFKRQFDDRLLCYTIAADYRGLSKRWRKDDENNNEDHDEWQSRIDKGVMNAWRWWMIKKICSIIGVQADKCSTMVKEYARCMTIDAQPDRYPTTCKKKKECARFPAIGAQADICQTFNHIKPSASVPVYV